MFVSFLLLLYVPLTFLAVGLTLKEFCAFSNGRKSSEKNICCEISHRKSKWPDEEERIRRIFFSSFISFYLFFYLYTKIRFSRVKY